MSDPEQTCPGQWRLYEQDTIRACGRQGSTTASCDSVQFSSNGYVYTEVCGRITGYQYNSPDAAAAVSDSLTPGNEINEPYLDGVSITYGEPREHIWSLFGGHINRCCGSQHNLNFIGNNSFCDTGNADGETWEAVLEIEHSGMEYLDVPIVPPAVLLTLVHGFTLL